MIEARITLEIPHLDELVEALQCIAEALSPKALAAGMSASPAPAAPAESPALPAARAAPARLVTAASGPPGASLSPVRAVPKPALHAKGHSGCAPERLVFTPERIAVLREEWPKGTPVEEIRALLEPLPGAPITSVPTIGVKAAGLGLKRPVGHPGSGGGPRKKADAAAPVAVAPGPQPVMVDWQQMEKWAAERGIMGLYEVSREEALEAVNAKRRSLGLPLFRFLALQAGKKALSFGQGSS